MHTGGNQTSGLKNNAVLKAMYTGGKNIYSQITMHNAEKYALDSNNS